MSANPNAPSFARKYAEVERPRLRYLTPASPSAAGGDDEGGPTDDLRLAASAAFRSACSLRVNLKKTHSTAVKVQPANACPESLRGYDPESFHFAIGRPDPARQPLGS